MKTIIHTLQEFTKKAPNSTILHDRFAFFVQSGTLVLLVVVAAIVLSAVLPPA